MMDRPTLYIVAGANGSGKSTLINRHRNLIKDVEFVNPDDIAKKIDPSYDGRDNLLTLKASREAVRKQNELLNKKQTFGIETTFSGNRELGLMKKAKELGYEVKLVYIGLNNPIENIKRVGERTKNGGHFVETDTIVRRYNKSMDNLEKGMQIADKTYLIDNSKSKEFIVAKFQYGKIISAAEKDIPKWVKGKTDLYQKIEKHIAHQDLQKAQTHSPESVKAFVKQQRSTERPSKAKEQGRER